MNKAYSLNFDSVQQRKALLNEDSYLNYICEKGILRLEILLSQKIVITDAQLYDGLFFFWMIELDEFENFITNGEKQNFIEIKNRKNNCFPNKMFLKPFVCSAIELKELSDCIYDVTSNLITEEMIKSYPDELKDLLKGRCIDPNENTPDIFIEIIDNMMQTTYKNMYDNEWSKYNSRLKTMDNILSKHKKIFSPWEDRFFLSNFLNYNNKEILSLIIDLIICEDNKYHVNYLYIDLINELGSKNIKRSKIYHICDELRRICKDNADICTIINKLMNIFDLFYNQALAYQHKCNYIFDNAKPINESKIEEFKFAKKDLWKLSQISWDQFGQIYLNIKNKDNFIDRLGEIHNSLDKINVEDQQILENGPWNYCNTNDYKLASDKVSDNDIHFINSDGTNSDEVYIRINNNIEPITEDKFYNLVGKIKLF